MPLIDCFYEILQNISRAYVEINAIILVFEVWDFELTFEWQSFVNLTMPWLCSEQKIEVVIYILKKTFLFWSE